MLERQTDRKVTFVNYEAVSETVMYADVSEEFYKRIIHVVADAGGLYFLVYFICI